MRVLRSAPQAVLLGGLLLASLYGCASTGEEPEPSASPHPTFPPGMISWDRISDFQREILADGEVTFADYERAIYAFQGCVEDEGLRFTDEPTYNEANRKFEHEIALGATQDAVREAESTISACAWRYITSVQTVWNWVNRPTQAELGDADDMWRECLVERGEDPAEVEALPAWGSDELSDWLYDAGLEEAQNPSAEIPAWRYCAGVIQEHFPTG